MQAYTNEMVQTFRTLAELTPSEWQHGTMQVADGTSLHYIRTGGNKPALLLLHGVQGAGLMWLRTAQALAAEYDVIMPDARGHGRSSRIEKPIEADVMQEDTLALLKTLQIERCFVVGHSMGADVAGRLATKQVARAAVLVDPALQNISRNMQVDVDNPPPWMADLFATLRALQTQPHEERMQTGLRILPPGTPQWNEADYVAMVDAMAQFDLQFYRSMVEMGYLFEATDLLSQIRCPILLLTARPHFGGVDVDAAVATLRRSIPAIQHVHFGDSGHFLMYDQFERFVSVVRQFLRQY